MFDLDREVTAWSNSVHADSCVGSTRSAELRDHLYCEVDRARSQGLSDEQAFAAAVAKMGESAQLAGEHAKGRSVFKSACAAAMRYERRDWQAGYRGPLMAHAIIWASLQVGVSLIVSSSDASVGTGLLLISLMTAMWWGSEQILRRALRQGGPR